MTNSTSEKIKKSALQLFAQKGYYGTSLNDVAMMVGVKKPSLYAHFKNKDDLYQTILIELLETFQERVRLASSEWNRHSAKELLFLFIQRMVDYWKDEGLGLLYKRSILFPEEKFQKLIQHQFELTEAFTTNILERIFTEGIKKQEIRTQPLHPLIDAFYCLVDGLFVQRFFYQEQDYEKKINHAFEHYWKGIESGGLS